MFCETVQNTFLRSVRDTSFLKTLYHNQFGDSFYV